MRVCGSSGTWRRPVARPRRARPSASPGDGRGRPRCARTRAGATTHASDARNSARASRAGLRRPGRAICGETRVSRGRAGRRRRRPCPGPTWAPRTAPTSPHVDLAALEAVGQPLGQRGRRAGLARSALARWATPTSTGCSPAAVDGQVLEPRQRPRQPSGPSRASPTRPSAMLQQRLDRERAAEQRRRGADPATAAQVLQGVDVEQRRRRLGRAPRAAAAASSGRAARVEHVGGGQRREPGARCRPAGCRRRDRDRRVDARPAGPTRRCRSCRRRGGPTRSPSAPVGRGLLVDLQHHRRRRPRRAHRHGTRAAPPPPAPAWHRPRPRRTTWRR